MKKLTSAILLLIGAVFVALPYFTPRSSFGLAVSPWVWLSCFALYTRTRSSRRGVLIGMLVFALANGVRNTGILTFGLSQLMPAFPAAAVNFIIAFALGVITYLPFVCDYLAFKSSDSFLGCLMLPFANVTLQMLFALLRFMPFFDLAYTQLGNAPFIQLCALSGEFSVAFMLCFSASGFAFTLLHPSRKVWFVWLCLLIAVNIGGSIRLWTAKNADEYLRAAYTTGPEVKMIDGEWELLPYDENKAVFERTYVTAVNGNAEIFATSEEAYSLSAKDAELFIENAATLVKQHGVPALIGLEIHNGDDSLDENTVVYISENGVERSYLKRYLTPFDESGYYEQGDGVLPELAINHNGKSYGFSYGICFDGDFGEYVSAMPDGTCIWFNPSWDWKSVSDAQAAIVGLRAVENGISLLKPTHDGLSAALDKYGHVLAKHYTETEGYAQVWFTDLPLNASSTPFRYLSPYIDLIYPVGLVFVGIYLILKHRKAQ